MKSFKEFYYLKEEAEDLSKANASKNRPINYNVASISSLVSKASNNQEKAEKFLTKYEGAEDLIQQVNGIKQKDKFMKYARGSEEQREALISYFILAKKLPEKADELGIEPQNLEDLEKIIEDGILPPLRKYARENNVENPSNKNAFEGKEKDEEEETPEEPSPEKEEDDEEETDDEEEADDEEETEEPEDKETPREQQPRAKSRTPEDLGVDKEKYPSPRDIQDQIEEIKNNTVEKIDNIKKKGEGKEHQRRIDRKIKSVEKTLNDFSKKAGRYINKYEVYPTRSSMRRASTNAKHYLSLARQEANALLRKAEAAQLRGKTERATATLKSAGQKLGTKYKDIAGSRAAERFKEASKAAGEKAAEATGQIARKGKEAGRTAQARVQEKLAVRQIEDALGNEKAQEFIKLSREGKEQQAEKLRQQAIQELKRQGKERKYDRMSDAQKKRAQRDRQAMKTGEKTRRDVAQFVGRKDDDKASPEDKQIKKVN